jgi:hypothetical protein
VRAIEFLCGPNVRRDAVGFLLAPHYQAFVVSGSVIKGLDSGDIAGH